MPDKNSLARKHVRAAEHRRPSTPSTGTVARALSLLTILADAGRPITLKEIAEKMGLPPSTVHRLLQLMRGKGFVAPSSQSGYYTVGNELHRVAAQIVSATKAPELAQQFIQSIASRFDESVLFGQYLPAQHAMCFAARADGRQLLKYQIEMNRPLSLIWGASGKSILAFLPDALIAEIHSLEGPSPAEGTPLPALNDLRRTLQVIRNRGYAVSESEKLPGARGIAAPVFGPDGVIGCLHLTSPKTRMPHGSIEEIGRTIVAAARELSLAFGAP